MNIPFIMYNSEESTELVSRILSRNQLNYGNVQETVNKILDNVQKEGDKAVFAYTEKFDGWKINENSILVTEKEIQEAVSSIPKNLIEVMKKAADRIRVYHEKQKRNSFLEPASNGEILGQMIRPLERVGVYVPGGKAAYPSSVLMNVIPAQVAGVKEIIMTTPAGKDGKISPNTAAAAYVAGVHKIFKVGGAQAIAALAYGTASIPKVDKICGPGNIYVALAKRTVYGHVNIDSVAGPSEILVLADESANPQYVAADLLSQAEHDEMASAVLITSRKDIADKVALELEKQTALLSRKEIIAKSLENFGAIVVTENIDQACQLANQVAPEHMELCVKDPLSVLTKIQNAGAVFMGNYSPEPLGDYMAGPNHVLPTGGTARFFSPLSVDDFIKKTSIISFSQEALLSLSDDIISFAESEGLTAHANAVRIRKE